MHILHPADKECKGITWICINLSKVEDGLNLLVINLSPRVIRGQSFEGFITAIPCHHVEARGPAVVDVCRRVIQVVRKEPLYKSLIEERIRPSRSGAVLSSRSGLTYHHSFSGGPDPDHRGWLQANEEQHRER